MINFGDDLTTTTMFAGFKPDVMCLQEMDRKHFYDYYQPLMLENGYKSIMLAKRHKKLPQDYNLMDVNEMGKFKPEIQQCLGFVANVPKSQF